MATILSITIPSYNYGHYLREAICSCLNQDDQFELVVLDNASTDDTPEIRKEFETDSRVRWYRNERLLPVQENWNRAVELAGGNWIKLLQADDRLKIGSIRRFLEIIAENQESNFIGHISDYIDSEGKVRRHQSPYRRDRYPMEIRAGAGSVLKMQHIARLKEPTSNLFTRQAFEAVGGYSTNLRTTFDIDFNVKIMTSFSGVLCSECLAEVRRHPSSDGAQIPPALLLGESRALVKKIVEQSNLPTTQRDAESWLQYRAVELSLQWLRRSPGDAFRFLLSERWLLLKFSYWPRTVQVLLRRLRTGDVQKVT